MTFEELIGLVKLTVESPEAVGGMLYDLLGAAALAEPEGKLHVSDIITYLISGLVGSLGMIRMLLDESNLAPDDLRCIDDDGVAGG